MDDMQEMISEFITDCSENLEEFENNLLDLEKNPTAPNLLDSMFRQIHSIKGASGFLAFSNLESLTHKSESVLDLIRQSKGSVNHSLISTFLDVCDAMKSIFDVIQEQGNDGDNNYPELIEKLIEFETAFKSGNSVSEDKTPVQEEISTMSDKRETEEMSFTQEETEASDEDTQELDPVQIESLKALGLYDEKIHGQKATEVKQETEDATAELDPVQIESLKALGLYDENMHKASSETPVEKKLEEKKEVKEVKKAQTENKKASAKVKETIRVDVDTLDHLVNLAGELVLIRNQILELSKNNETTAFEASFTNLDMITGEIQKSLMTTRMQPISTVWSKMPRIVRDLSSQLGREIELQMQGEHTELDKTIIEAITDPMTHIIRNCCDHGIEMPEDRIAAGKPSKGTIKLSAEHRGNWIYVDIIDDGKGISKEVLKRKAIEKGLHTEEELEQMDDQQIINIIFHPGFSTKDQASNISGRGVGMDVIKSNIMKINANVELTSEEGKGTHLKIRLPLTLAIIPGVVVLINNERYAIPQNSVQEVASVRQADIENFDNIAGQKFTRLRGNILPLVYSSSVLELEANENENDTLNYVVINADGFKYGLVIDKVTDIIEIVVKPLESEEDFKYYAGATIMGDGKVALILDPSKIAELSKIDKLNIEDEIKDAEAISNSSDLTLAFSLDNEKNYLIPLNKTSRIEEIKKSDLDFRDIGTFAKFHGKVIRVIDLMKLLGSNASKADDQEQTLKTLYYEFNGHGIAVNVGDNQTLLQEDYEIEACDGSEFVMGTTLIKDTIYEVLNLEDYLGTIIGSAQTIQSSESNEQTTQFEENANKISSKLFDSKNSVISFNLGNLYFGVQLDAVSEIINHNEVTTIPGSRPSVQGLLNLRGEIMVSRELSKILNLEESTDKTTEVIKKSLIVKHDDKKVCLEIENINEILNLSEDSFNNAPSSIPAKIHSYLKGVHNIGDNMLLLLDEKKIVSELFSPELNTI